MISSANGIRGVAKAIDLIKGGADPLDAIKLFVESGADVNDVNDAGNTALHYAAQTGSTRIVEFLASKGARLDVQNYQGKTPLDLAKGATRALEPEEKHALDRAMRAPIREPASSAR